MKELIFSMADPLCGVEPEGCIIRIINSFPKHGGLLEQMTFHQKQAEGIAMALALALPQATLERLALELMGLHIGAYQGRIKIYQQAVHPDFMEGSA